jgi:hypothetical protein
MRVVLSFAIAAALALGGARASAAPLSLSVDIAEGLLAARRAGVFRDDAELTARLGYGVGRHTAVELGFDADLERLELGVRLGARVRPWLGRRWSPYLRGELALVGANRIGLDYELTGGVGLWLRLHRWAAAFAEVDVAVRFLPVSLADHFTVGIALTAPSAWR